MFSETIIMDTIIGMIADGAVNMTKDKIEILHKNKQARNKNFYTRMYNAVLNTFKKYYGSYCNGTERREEENILDIAELFMEQCMTYNNSNGLKGILSHYLGGQLSNGEIEAFMDILYSNIVKDEDLRNEYNLRLATKIYESNKDIRKKVSNLSDILLSIEDIINTANTIKEFCDLYIMQGAIVPQIKFQENKKADYLAKWNQRLFLHRRKNDSNFTLANTFIAPSYSYEDSINNFNIQGEIIEDKHKIIQDDLEKTIVTFIEEGRTLLLQGQPGIGKTSIVCFLAWKYKDNPDVIILRFRDWDEEEWKDLDHKLLKNIKIKLNCSNKDLKGKILILDGFDEIKYSVSDYNLMREFLLDIKEIENFKVIITSRINYIRDYWNFQYVITLLPFDTIKIQQYATKILGEEKACNSVMVVQNTEIYGVPVILYMALSTGIDISLPMSKNGIYEKVFDLQGGIFDRFSTGIEEGYEASSHNLTYVKEAFYNILCNSAFEIFNNEVDCLTQNMYETIIENENTTVLKNSPIWLDFPIDNLYEKGTEIRFVHNSIYEYFVAEYFYRKIAEIFKYIETISKVDNKLHEYTAYKLCELFDVAPFTNEICTFLKEKISKSYFGDMKHFQFLMKTFKLMLKDGMTYYCKKDKCKNVFFKEVRLFVNLMRLIHLWTLPNEEVILFSWNEKKRIAAYLMLRSQVSSWPNENTQYEDDFGLMDLSNMDLQGINLKSCILRNTKLNGSKLMFATLIGVDLRGSSLVNTNLENSNLKGADLSDTDLTNIHLANTILTDVKYAKDTISYY